MGCFFMARVRVCLATPELGVVDFGTHFPFSILLFDGQEVPEPIVG